MTTRLEYEVTVDDHLAKIESFARDSPVARNFTWFAYFAIVGLAWMSAVLFYVKQGHQNYGYIISGAFALVLTLTLPTLYRWYQSSFWASVFTPTAVQGIVGRKVLKIHDDFFEEVGEKLTLRANWRDVQKIESDPLRTWLILAPLIAIVIPNATFQSVTEQVSFLRESKDRIAAQSAVAAQSVGHDAADDAASNASGGANGI